MEEDGRSGRVESIRSEVIIRRVEGADVYYGLCIWVLRCTARRCKVRCNFCISSQSSDKDVCSRLANNGRGHFHSVDLCEWNWNTFEFHDIQNGSRYPV